MLKQAILVNKDLKMGVGKLCVQIGHAEVMYMQEIMVQFPNYKDQLPMVLRFYEWKSETPEDPIGMQKKVVLKSTEAEIKDMYIRLKNLNIWCYLMYDRGLTQVAPNSLTCLIVEPLEDLKYNELFGNLKLL